MSRDATPYGDRREVPEHLLGQGIRIDADPIPGFYRMRLRSGGVPVGIKIWFGPPHDPVTGEELDRSLRWQAHCNGEYIDIDRVWPKCAAETITEIDYNRHCVKQQWARENVPDHALAKPTKEVDYLKSPLLF